MASSTLALLFAWSPWLEKAFLPLAVAMQVTLLIAIAPLLLIYLDAPGAVLACAFLVAFFLPQIFTGLRIGGGLALIGAVAAELAAGAAGSGEGLAFRIVEAGYRLKIPLMFAAVALLCMCGIGLYGGLALASHVLLRRWRDENAV